MERPKFLAANDQLRRAVPTRRLRASPLLQSVAAVTALAAVVLLLNAAGVAIDAADEREDDYQTAREGAAFAQGYELAKSEVAEVAAEAYRTGARDGAALGCKTLTADAGQAVRP